MKQVRKDTEKIHGEYEELLQTLKHDNSKLDLGFMLDMDS